MKRIALHFFLMFACISYSDGQELSKVSIRNANTNYPPFIVSLNGVRLSNAYAASFNFDYLDERNYRVKILQAGSGNMLNFVVNSAPDYVSKYILTKDNNGNYTLILESKVLMTGSDEAVTSASGANPATNTVAPSPAASPVVTAMADAAYNDMLKSVKKESMESAKLEMAKTFFGSQDLSSAQVLGILKSFSVESTKVTFAKFAYSRTVDKQNYYNVYDAFYMGSSKKEMSEYIKNNP